MKINHKKDREKISLLYKKFFQENKEIYLLAGELNPDFYNHIIEEYYPLAKDASINIICGPYISVEDKLFLKYHDVQNDRLGNWWYAKRKDEWWKAHPMFKAADENNNIELYIIRNRYEPHFFIGVESNDVVVEDPHEELQEGGATVYLGNPEKTKEYISIWNQIKERKCFKWDKNIEERLFKPISKIERELELGEKINKEFSNFSKVKV